jgi:hypothetical protein
MWRSSCVRILVLAAAVFPVLLCLACSGGSSGPSPAIATVEPTRPASPTVVREAAQLVAPTATPVPPTPEPIVLPDRTNCAEIRADAAGYRSDGERAWFIANCNNAPAASSAAPPPSGGGAAAAPPPAPAGPRTVTVSLCNPATTGILLFRVTSGSFAYSYDASVSGLNLQPADLVSTLTIPNVPPGTYQYQANTLNRSGSLLQTYSRTSDQDRIVQSPFC